MNCKQLILVCMVPLVFELFVFCLQKQPNFHFRQQTIAHGVKNKTGFKSCTCTKFDVCGLLSNLDA